MPVCDTNTKPARHSRILVVGCGGAGKSTLARKLSAILNLELIHLDWHFWKPGWQATDAPQWERKVTDLLSAESWIMDGNFHHTLEMRLERADTLIFVDRTRWICLFRIWRRWFRWYGRNRPDLPEGCPEKIDFGFMRWIWNYPREVRPELLEIVERHRHRIQVYHCLSDRDTADLLEEFGNGE